MTLRKHTLFLTGALLTALLGPVQAQDDISIVSQVDKAKILIGDVVRYTLRVTHGEKITVEMPSQGANLGQFELRSYQVIEPKKEKGKITTGTDYLISTFDTGEYEIPPLTVRYRMPGDTTQHLLKSEPIKILVQSLNPSEAGDIRDIKPPMTPPRDIRSLVLIGLGVVALIAAALAGWWYVQRKRQGKSILPVRQEPPRPAHEIALEELNALFAGDWLATGRVKDYHSELADILRRYCNGRYYIDALEMTSRELLSAMRKHDIQDDLVQQMQDILLLCDMAKFAKYVPSAAETERVSRSAVEFVERTKLVWEAPVPADTAESVTVIEEGR